MPDDRRHPPRSGHGHGQRLGRVPTPPDDELRESLELLATVAASVSDRVEGQSAALDRMAKVLAETRTAAFAARKHTDPERTAEQVAAQVERYVLPSAENLGKVVLGLARETATTARVMDEARALRRDMDTLKAHEDREAARWRDRRRTLLLWGVPVLLALLLLTALLAPRALALDESLCTLVGGLPLGDGSATRPGCWFPALW